MEHLAGQVEYLQLGTALFGKFHFDDAILQAGIGRNFQAWAKGLDFWEAVGLHVFVSSQIDGCAKIIIQLNIYGAESDRINAPHYVAAPVDKDRIGFEAAEAVIGQAAVGLTGSQKIFLGSADKFVVYGFLIKNLVCGGLVRHQHLAVDLIPGVVFTHRAFG